MRGHVTHRRTDARGQTGLRSSPLWLPHRQHPQRNQQARQANHDEHALPRFKVAHDRRVDCRHDGDDRAADNCRQTCSNVDGAEIKAEGDRARARREVIADQRIGARHQGGFANANADSGEEHLREVPGEPAKHRHDAPHRDARSNNGRAPLLVNQAAQRQAKHGVKDGKGEAVQKAELGIRNIERFPDRPDEQGERLTIKVGEGIGHDQDAQGIPFVEAALLLSAKIRILAYVRQFFLPRRNYGDALPNHQLLRHEPQK